MSPSLKPLAEQVVVLTGATSGIGLVTARLLAREGASLALVARNGEALGTLASEMTADGAQVLTVEADVGARDDVARIARETVTRFGRIDAWVNNAGVAIYGATWDVPWDDQRRLFETNYWGVVAGSLEALAQFDKQAGAGGGAAMAKIVNLGSALSDVSMIYQGPYSASKHAVKGFTDALRTEIEAAGKPVSVTLVKPGAIDTPYMEHARSYMDSAGTRNPPPSYDPALVADAIAHALTHDVRDLDVGAGGWVIAKLGQIAPGLTDLAMEATGRALQTSDARPRPGMRDNLHSPARDLEERSAMPGLPARRTSLLLEAEKHPVGALAAGALLGATLAALVAARR